MNQSLIVLGAAVAGYGVMWITERYFMKKSRADLNATGVTTNDMSKQDLDKLNTSAAQIVIQADKLTATADTIIQDTLVQTLTKIPRKMIPKMVKDFDIKRKTQPLHLLNEIFICLNFRVKVVKNPPPEILVECTIEGHKFSAQAPSKKAAQRIIAIEALDYFFEE